MKRGEQRAWRLSLVLGRATGDGLVGEGLLRAGPTWTLTHTATLVSLLPVLRFPQAIDSRTVPPHSTFSTARPSPPLPAYLILDHWRCPSPAWRDQPQALRGPPLAGAHSSPSLFLPQWAPAPGAPVLGFSKPQGSPLGPPSQLPEVLSLFLELHLRAMNLLSITSSGTLSSGLQAPQGASP